MIKELYAPELHSGWPKAASADTIIASTGRLENLLFPRGGEK
jgi:hypothetical protein